MKGYNGCVIAYGPYNSGETHHSSTTVHHSSERQRSIVSRAADDIFTSPEAAYVRVRVSFYHVSNEKIYDLLESQVSEVCRIHDTEETVFLDGLREVEVSSAQDLLRVYRRGAAHRNTGVSKGDFASKSHMVFCVTVIHTRGHSDSEGVFMSSKLTLVDLASASKSECHSSTALDMRRGFHVTPENPQEAKTLKRSLTIFRNVIFCLSAAVSQHVPYRESKLTRALRDCVAGNCRTCLLVTLATQSTSVTETMSCLQFAARAMNVPSRVIHPSLTRYTPAQVPDVWTTEKNSAHVPRTQGPPPGTTDRRAQAMLPPILASAGTLQLPVARVRASIAGGGGVSFLPLLQQHRDADLSGQHGRAPHSTDGRNTDSSVCVVKAAAPRSPRLPVGGCPGKESALSSHQHSAVKLSSSSSSSALASSPTLGTVSECLNCRQERKIREEYDKFIIQVKRDRDLLSERVMELERELERRGRREEGETGRDVRHGETGGEVRRGETGRDVRHGETGGEVRRGETGREVRHGETGGEVRRGETGRDVRHGETGGEVRRGETGRDVRHGETGGEVRRGETGRQEETGREVRRREFGREVSQGEGKGDKKQERRRRKEESENEESDGKRPEGEKKDERGTAAGRRAPDPEERNGEERKKDRSKEERAKESDSTGRESNGSPLSALEAQDSSEAELISHMDDSKNCYEKVCLENAELKAQLEALLKVVNSKTCSGCHGNTNTHASKPHINKHSSHTQTDAHCLHTERDTHSSHTQTDTHSSHTHTVTTNTEMVVVSHSISQQCTTDLLQGETHTSVCSSIYLCVCVLFLKDPPPLSLSHSLSLSLSFSLSLILSLTHSLSEGSECFCSSPGSPIPSESTSHTCQCESKLQKTNFYKQLRREHSLLLDVMLVLYKREWFLQDAVPYVRRTLTKCGLTLGDAD
ncbi:uncharacterized protein LOC143480842 isoform X2 [Brachyhypopomus gauderio]